MTNKTHSVANLRTCFLRVERSKLQRINVECSIPPVFYHRHPAKSLGAAIKSFASASTTTSCSFGLGAAACERTLGEFGRRDDARGCAPAQPGEFARANSNGTASGQSAPPSASRTSRGRRDDALGCEKWLWMVVPPGELALRADGRGCTSGQSRFSRGKRGDARGISSSLAASDTPGLADRALRGCVRGLCSPRGRTCGERVK